MTVVAGSLGIVAGVLLAVGGFWSMLLARRGRDDGGGRGRLPIVGDVGVPTLLVLGLIGIALGYHVAAWSWPGMKIPTAVPVANWWWLVVISIVAVAGSFMADALERD
ncbi:MAG: hypothetical protein AAF747_05175 [Planctomycetota bacterium]